MNSDTIDIDDASAGMTLADDLHDSRGAVLLPAGASLSEATLNSLRRRGIERLCVQAAAAASEPADDAALEGERERQCARLQRLFRRSAGVQASDALLARLVQYRRQGAA
ncbi:MAG: hypothetical protein ABIT83_04890 [Massilia sp.]